MSFATSVGCIDGRIQEAVAGWARREFGADHVDTVTEPGMDRRLSDPETAARVRRAVEISVRAHKSSGVAVAGHHECAAAPGGRGEHERDIRRAAEVVRSWGLGVRVAGVWVGEDWSAGAVETL